MTVVDTIIDKFKTDLIDSIQTARGYNTDPMVKYGVYLQTEAPSLPFVGFADDGIEIEQLMGGMALGWITIFVYGYANWGGIETTNSIRDLALDVMYFIYNEYTYTDDTKFTSKLEILPGNDSNPVSVFSVEIKVKFHYRHTEINK
jgi:hypothetical protein